MRLFSRCVVLSSSARLEYVIDIRVSQVSVFFQKSHPGFQELASTAIVSFVMTE